MSGLTSRNKGKRAERQVIEILQPIVDIEYNRLYGQPPVLQRNTLQSDNGGFDICGLDWLALEVKHQEQMNVDAWWEQTLKQSVSQGCFKEPVLFYKRNNVAFRVRMLGELKVKRSSLTGGVMSSVTTCVDIDVEYFKLWFALRLAYEIQKAIDTGRLLVQKYRR